MRSDFVSTQPVEPEELFRAVAGRDWERALYAAHTLRSETGEVANQARAVLVTALVDELGEPAPCLTDDALERILLLDRAGFLAMPSGALDRAASVLVERNLTSPGRAARYARFRPDADACRAVLAQFGDVPAERRPGEGGRVEESALPSRPDAGRSIFRSRQEAYFYKAAVRVFSGKLVVPNAALHAAVDYDAVRGLLNASEREIFFRVLIDLAVFDPDRGFRPSVFLELDSPWHDDPQVSERDRLKERIIHLAGCRLLRIRTRPEAGMAAIMDLIRAGLRA